MLMGEPDSGVRASLDGSGAVEEGEESVESGEAIGTVYLQSACCSLQHRLSFLVGQLKFVVRIAVGSFPACMSLWLIA